MGITARQFEQMQKRLSRDGRMVSPVLQSTLKAPVSLHRTILGIDPSMRGTGYGVIRMNKPHPETLTHGTIVCPHSWEHSRCLMKITQAVREVIQQHRPTVCVVEGVFYAQNLQTAIVMGEARGASLVAVGEAGLPSYEIATRKVKQAIVGYGAAQKLAVSKMVQKLLNLAEQPAPDAADALALALTYAHEQSRYAFSSAKKI